MIGRDGLLDMYMKLQADYPIVFLEDPFAEDDWDNFTKITAKGVCPARPGLCSHVSLNMQ